MKKIQLKEIIGLVESFSAEYLNEELAECALRLCNKLGRSRKLDITRGKREIWAAAIVYVIARSNFLFDKASDDFLTSDIICDFFNTKKTTTGNKATVIEKALNISIGDKDCCTQEIVETCSFVELPGGFVLPKRMIDAVSREIVIEIGDEEESREIEEFMARKQQEQEDKERLRKERRAEINREIAEKKRKKKEEKQAKINERQLKLW
ncbi:DUF6398 domain-containing protein [Desulfogranum marinum]|uniref:DUF6398 domain-containing protein n=1 Tax=Desulfogranum marinum TaxID=453220 RepID=UPI0019663A9F|nr:DUF6398 domain-containing protein [Desulfogranum marinum]MBM9511926.1 hypothetical protein [Desulfogranum marinum]